MSLVFQKNVFFSPKYSSFFDKRVPISSIFNILKQATLISPSRLQESQHFVEKGFLLRHQKSAF